MHHIIYVKAWAGDAEEAENLVRDAMEESIQPEHNTVGWDYFDSVELLKEKDLLQHKTFEEFEKKCIEQRNIEINNAKAMIKEELMLLLAPSFLTKTEAVLHINTENEDFKKCVEHILKKKTDIKVPDSFEKILNIITEVTASIAKKDTGHGMAMYYMEQIKKLQYCIDDPSPYNTLQCTANNYAELPCDDKEGLTAFYFSCDRHF
jgi:hypothetical protein